MVPSCHHWGALKSNKCNSKGLYALFVSVHIKQTHLRNGLNDCAERLEAALAIKS